VVVWVALLLLASIAVLAAARAQGAQFKMVACAVSSGAPPYRTETNTVNAQHPNGIFDFGNNCGGAGGDPPGDAAYLRLSEHEASGNAGEGSYGAFIFETPAYVHFKSGGGYTREPNAFNDGWRAIFWGIDFSNNGQMFLNQGSGVSGAGINSPASGIFGPHLWPFGGYMDFHHFFFELRCVRPAGCDRTNFNAVDANGFVFILNDDQAPNLLVLAQDSPVMEGKWVSGSQWLPWYVQDNGSGLRNERVLIDGQQRYLIDHQAQAECNATSSQTNGEFSRNFQPCPTGPFWHSYSPDTATLSDGGHELSICVQDYGQYQGLNGTGGWTCDNRPIHVDNHAPGAPAGLQVVTPNPARYENHFRAQFSLPPDPGSPIAKAHYDVIDAAGKEVVPEKVVAGTNPTQIPEVVGPPQAGDYRLRVWLEDSVGFVGPAATVAVPRDTTPPAAPQEVSVAAPTTTRAAQAFDVRWRDIQDAGSPITAVHYQVVRNGGGIVVPTTTITGDTPQSIQNLDSPPERGDYTLKLWLSDAEGNAGAPVSVPLSYNCGRSDAGGGVTLTTGLGRNERGTQTVREKESAVLSGALDGVSGPIANAPLCIFSRVATHEVRQFLGVALTGPNGRYKFAIGAGPSRQLTVAYRPDQREMTASASIKTIVRPSLRLRGRLVKNGDVAVFTGSIPGPDNANVVVGLEAKSGKGWRVFRLYRTRKGGRFIMRYRFTQTFTPTTYLVHAKVRRQSGYSYEQGSSRTIPVPVVP